MRAVERPWSITSQW